MIADAWKDDLVIDFNNQLVDLSNLLSTRAQRRSTLKEVPLLSPKRPPRRRLYPIVPTADSIEKEQLTKEMEQLTLENSYAPRKHNLRDTYNLQSVPLLQEDYPHPPLSPPPRPGTATFCSPRCSLKEDEKIAKISKENGSYGSMQIEVYPGVFAPLRGAEETSRAFALQRFRDATCFDCSAKLRCIQDAEYVLCPKCKVISPLLTENGHGIGLGLMIG
jgi:hypothetical protein